MKRVTHGMLLFLLSMSVAGVLIAMHGGQRIPEAKPAVTKQDQERLLAIGKKLFIERCAKCHDERGDKPLASGPPLSERDLQEEQIARAVAGRFRDKSDEQKRAVVLYIKSFVKKRGDPRVPE